MTMASLVYADAGICALSKLSGCETDSLVKEAVSYPVYTPVANMTHEHQGEIADTDRRR